MGTFSRAVSPLGWAPSAFLRRLVVSGPRATDNEDRFFCFFFSDDDASRSRQGLNLPVGCCPAGGGVLYDSKY